jgi:hypothetical protein
MWPRIAKMFGMEMAYPVPLPLNDYMADMAPIWNEMVRKYGLQPIDYKALVSWPFGDFILNSGFDNITSTIKARRAGYHDCIDTEDMFSNFFASLRTRKVIPA